MSETYRDDVNDTAVAIDSTWMRMRSIVESTGRGRDVLLFGLSMLIVDGAMASDAIMDRVRTVVAETAVGADEVIDHARTGNLIVERANGADEAIGRTLVLLVEQGRGADELAVGVRQITAETGRGSDVVIDQRYAADVVADSSRGRDVLMMIQRTLVDDIGHGADLVLDRAKAKALTTEVAHGEDGVLDSVKARPVVLVDVARGVDEVLQHVKASTMVNDLPAVGWDEIVHTGGLIGQAWTADASSWAMCRYQPFAFTGLTVIDGVVYATAPDGIYALDGADEHMVAEVRTGLIDMSGEKLALPVESHIEYELSGTATMDVTQTQSGQRQTFNYPLQGRPVADALTNARFEFGRGLLGRHFAYTLRLDGKSAYINDWKVLALPSNRSI